MSKLNIYQRLAAVMKACQFVEKDTTVTMRTGRSYKGVSHDAVISELRPHLIEHGVLIAPTVIKEDFTVLTSKNDKGYESQSYICRLTVQISFINVDDPKDRHDCIAIGYGFDPGDKAPGKAFSYAVKTGILKTLSIETGENDEEREQGDKKPVQERKGPTEAQMKRLFAIAKQAGVPTTKLDAFLSEVGKIKSKTELNPKQYDYICNLMESGKFFDEFNKRIPQTTKTPDPPADESPPWLPDGYQ